MRKRQKLILILYAFVVFLFTFVYVPYNKFYAGGVKRYVGHHIRTRLWEYVFGQDQWPTTRIRETVIDAPLIIAEVLAFTVIAVVAVLLLQRKESSVLKNQ
jgi:hypothetical protein